MILKQKQSQNLQSKILECQAVKTSPAEDTPISDDSDTKAETEPEFTVEDSEMSAAKTSPAHDTPPPDDNDSEIDETNTQT